MSSRSAPLNPDSLLPQVSVARPRLLVSVRNVEEASAALAGGCDILDLKEPDRGSLGRPADETVVEVAAWLQQSAPHIPLSAALGEARDWLADAGQLPGAAVSSLAFVKLGCAGIVGNDWLRKWNEARRRAVSPAENPRWIAVAYADWREADAPTPAEIITGAIAEQCAGVLFDTFHKDGRTLFDYLDDDELTEAVATVQNAGLLVALAGGLLLREVPRAASFSPDVIAVRTAACRAGRRNAPIATAAVRELRQTIETTPINANVRQAGVLGRDASGD
ncbi:MAG TPA: (5-formylfuran-3-yl)methyl phosphate synthase [Planctomycetaceae bacterium]|nr:(5-formylfuran-3-yl)methyl phosphate synthase [Planctomycetaceae bacterium]